MILDINIGQLSATGLAIAGILIIAVAIFAIVKARSGEIRDVGKIIVGVLIAAFLIAIGTNTQHIKDLGNWLWDLFFS